MCRLCFERLSKNCAACGDAKGGNRGKSRGGRAVFQLGVFGCTGIRTKVPGRAGRVPKQDSRSSADAISGEPPTATKLTRQCPTIRQSASEWQPPIRPTSLADQLPAAMGMTAPAALRATAPGSIEGGATAEAGGRARAFALGQLRSLAERNGYPVRQAAKSA